MSGKQPEEMLILAGGFGTRLQSMISDVPKPMAPVAGRPFIAYLLKYWASQGVCRFVISTGYLGNAISQYFGKTFEGASIEYSHERSPLGTGGAIKLALNDVEWEKDDIITINGDTWFPVNLQALHKDAVFKGCPITLAIKTVETNDRYAGVAIDKSGMVRKFNVRATVKPKINGGCYLLNARALRGALQYHPDVFSFERDFLPLFAENKMVGASMQNQPFLDIGIPVDYQKASQLLKEFPWHENSGKKY